VSVIRPLRKGDLPQVAELYELVMRSGSRTPPRRLADYFQRLLDHPWADPEIPSLVYEDKTGRIVGFIGSHVRHLRFDGQRLRMGLTGQLMSDPDPDVRNRAVGAMLLRRYLAGPQDLTITSGTGETARIWKALGGQVIGLRSISWIRIFDLPSTASYLLKRLGMAAWRPVTYPLLSAAQLVTNRLPGASLRVPEPATRAEDLSPRALIEYLPSVSDHLRMRPDYDETFLAWLFQEMAEVRSRGKLVKRLVCAPGGRVLGWYVTYLQPGGVSHVMQIGAKDRDVEAVIDHLFHDAQRSRAAFLTGQLEPQLFEPLTRRRCLLHPVVNFLVQSRNPGLLDAVLAGQAMISRMEGEGWMGHDVEPFS
jgi:hypothetical protein